MDIFPIIKILLPVSVAACVALKKDMYSNSKGFRHQKWQFNDVLIVLMGLACVQLICLFAFKKNSISAHELGVYGTVIFSFTIVGIVYISMIRKYGRDSLSSFFPPGRINKKILFPVIYFLAYLTIVFGYAYFTNNDQIILGITEKLQYLQIFRGSILESITYVVGLVLVAPVLEEILYRGIFFLLLKESLGAAERYA